MCPVGFAMGITKRPERRAPANFHPYIWRGGHILAHVRRGALFRQQIYGREGGDRNAQALGDEVSHLQRRVGSSGSTSGSLRRASLVNDEWCGSARAALGLEVLRGRRATFGDIHTVINGGAIIASADLKYDAIADAFGARKADRPISVAPPTV